MPLQHLAPSDQAIVQYVLSCISKGDVILHDWEFEMVMGNGLETFFSVLKAWPSLDESQTCTQLAINNAFHNLLGYPHKYQDNWEARFDVSKAEMLRVYKQWKTC